MAQNESTGEKRNPAWVSTLVLILLLACGGALVWWWLSRPSDSGVEVVAVDSVNGNGARRTPQTPRPMAGPIEGVFKSRDGQITVRIQDSHLFAHKHKPEVPYNISLSFGSRWSWLNKEQQDLHYQATRILNYPALAEAVGLTTAQRQELNKLPYNVVLTADEQQLLNKVLQAWDTSTGAAKPAAERPLLDAVAKIGAAHLAPAKAAMLKRVEAIPKILTTEQLDKARHWVDQGPASRPAAVRPMRQTTRPTTGPSGNGAAVAP